MREGRGGRGKGRAWEGGWEGMEGAREGRGRGQNKLNTHLQNTLLNLIFLMPSTFQKNVPTNLYTEPFVSFFLLCVDCWPTKENPPYEYTYGYICIYVHIDPSHIDIMDYFPVVYAILYSHVS